MKMDLAVFDGDPGQLGWQSRRGTRSLIGLYQPGKGFVEEGVLSGQDPPTDEELERVFERAKAKSKQDFENSSSVSTFVVLRRIRAGESEKSLPIAEYFNGQLEAYCRPPWRKGQSL